MVGSMFLRTTLQLHTQWQDRNRHPQVVAVPTRQSVVAVGAATDKVSSLHWAKYFKLCIMLLFN